MADGIDFQCPSTECFQANGQRSSNVFNMTMGDKAHRQSERRKTDPMLLGYLVKF